tara:strand:+ start:570 stop:779 length:210 start_codon:yes stop_codon:yes gene_type:complete
MRGGARKYTGRKPLPEEERRVPFNCMVTPETKKYMVRLSENGKTSLGMTLDKIVKERVNWGRYNLVPTD